jgi:hypothetical protein
MQCDYHLFAARCLERRAGKDKTECINETCKRRATAAKPSLDPSNACTVTPGRTCPLLPEHPVCSPDPNATVMVPLNPHELYGFLTRAVCSLRKVSRQGGALANDMVEHRFDGA